MSWLAWADGVSLLARAGGVSWLVRAADWPGAAIRG